MTATSWLPAGPLMETQTGPWGTIEPSGGPMRFSGVNIFRFADGKVAEIWNHRDDLGLMTQLGVPVFAGSTEPMEKGGAQA